MSILDPSNLTPLRLFIILRFIKLTDMWMVIYIFFYSHTLEGVDDSWIYTYVCVYVYDKTRGSIFTASSVQKGNWEPYVHVRRLTHSYADDTELNPVWTVSTTRHVSEFIQIREYDRHVKCKMSFISLIPFEYLNRAETIDFPYFFSCLWVLWSL